MAYATLDSLSWTAPVDSPGEVGHGVEFDCKQLFTPALNRARHWASADDADMLDFETTTGRRHSGANEAAISGLATPPDISSYAGHERRMPFDQELEPIRPDTTTTALAAQDWETGFDDGDLGNKYEFRQKPREAKRLYSTTWLDEDDTGDFDPDEALRAERAARYKKPRVAATERSLCANGAQDRAQMREPKVMPEIPVVLQFDSDGARQDVVSILAKDSLAAIPASEGSSTGYSLRSRRLIPICAEDGDEDRAHQRSDGRPDLTGHPAARGCYGCYDLGLRCPILDNELQWPCDHCKTDESECALITDPKVKRPCEGCKRRKVKCSFTCSPDHQGPCEGCKEDGFVCIAGPANDARNTRRRYDRDNANAIPTKKRIPTTPAALPRPCTKTACNDSKQSTSDANLTLPIGPTSSETLCITSTEGQIPEGPAEVTKHSLARPQHSQRPAAIKSVHFESPKKDTETVKSRLGVQQSYKEPLERAFSRASRPPTLAANFHTLPHADLHAEVVSRHQIDAPTAAPAAIHRSVCQTEASTKTITTITTKFCHPIHFFHKDEPRGRRPCNFCSEPGYQFFGMGAKPAVRVHDWADGRGLSELSGGHCADGLQPTRICPSCTLARLDIVTCRRHQPRPLVAAFDPPSRRASDVLTLDAAWEELANPPTKGGGLRHRWCSVCPSLATHECAAETEEGSRGCGLLLCEPCRSQLVGLFDGDLHQMLTVLRDVPTSERPMGLRADAGLLRRDGLLVRFLMYSSRRWAARG